AGILSRYPDGAEATGRDGGVVKPFKPTRSHGWAFLLSPLHSSPPAIRSHHRASPALWSTRMFIRLSHRWLPCLVLLLASVPLLAAEPASDTARGDRQLDAYFRHQTKLIADACLADIKTKADWERQRPELRRQFLEMMGLWPLPPRTDLKPV